MDGNRFSPQMDSNMHHRGVWTESRWMHDGQNQNWEEEGFIVNMKTVLRHHQFVHLQWHKLVVFWGDRGSRERHHFFLEKEGRPQFLSESTYPYPWSTLNPFLLQCHCCCWLTARRSPEIVSDQSLLLIETTALRFQWVPCLPLLAGAMCGQSTLLST